MRNWEVAYYLPNETWTEKVGKRAVKRRGASYTAVVYAETADAAERFVCAMLKSKNRHIVIGFTGTVAC